MAVIVRELLFLLSFCTFLFSFTFLSPINNSIYYTKSINVSVIAMNSSPMIININGVNSTFNNATFYNFSAYANNLTIYNTTSSATISFYVYTADYNYSKYITNRSINVSYGYTMRDIMNNLDAKLRNSTNIVGENVIGLYDLFTLMVFFVIALTVRVVDFELRIIAGSFVSLLMSLILSLMLGTGVSMFFIGIYLAVLLVAGVIYGFMRWLS